MAMSHGVAVGQELGGYETTISQASGQQQQRGAEVLAPALAEDEKKDTWDQRRPCNQPPGTTEADLCQQWRMAKATEELVALTDWQISLSYWEMVLLVLTSAGTIGAAWAAASAARAARDNVKWLVRVERPRFVMDRIYTSGMSNARNAMTDQRQILITISARIRNVGRGTGFLEALGAVHAWRLPSRPPALSSKDIHWRGHAPIETEKYHVTTERIEMFSLTYEEAELVFSYQKRLFLHGFIQYSDVHGITWHAGFAQEYNPGGPDATSEGAFTSSDLDAYRYDVEYDRSNERKRRWWPFTHIASPRHRP